MEVETQQSGAWTCSKCRETVDADFEQCWNCGSDRHGRADPTFQRAVKPSEPSDFCPGCGYPRQGLERMDCPECGAIFEASPRMLPEADAAIPNAQEQHLINRKHKTRQVLLYSWIGLWFVCPAVTLLIGTSHFDNKDDLFKIWLICCLVLFCTIPIVFVWFMLPDDKT